ncbi:MAG: methyltransferase domain-containing protein [Pseudolabrys sp.]
MGKFLLRNVEPELADHIPGDDPRALRFRRDLSRLNALTMTDRVMARTLLKHWGSVAPREIVDLGAGDGTFMLRVAQRLAPRWRDVTVKLVDQQDIVGAHARDGFAAVHWNIQTVPADVFEFLQKMQLNVDIVIANGFLHHFTAERLTRLLSLAAGRAKLIVAGEPRRTHFAREVSRFVWLLGCGDVIRHDVLASIRAGFVRKEISASWPTRDGWVVEERDAGPFWHTFAARRESAPSHASR